MGVAEKPSSTLARFGDGSQQGQAGSACEQEKMQRLRRRLMESLERFVKWESGQGAQEARERGRRGDRWRQSHLEQVRHHASTSARLEVQLVHAGDANRGVVGAPRTAMPAEYSLTFLQNRHLWLSQPNPWMRHIAKSRRLLLVQGRPRERVGQRSPSYSTPTQASVMRCCRSGSLTVDRSGCLRWSKSFRCEVEGLGDVLFLQIRIKIEDLIGRKAARHHIEHHGYWDPETTNAGCSTQLIRARGDAGEGHGGKVAQAAALDGGSWGGSARLTS